MKIFQAPRLEEPVACPYLPGQEKRYEYFLAADLTGGELAELLAAGWRKFGVYFFRPACPGCRQCIPLRVPVAAFAPSRSQRRVLRAGRQLVTRFEPLRPSPRAFAIYREHAAVRFGQESTEEEFLMNFYLPSCPGLQTELTLDGELIAVGFLDLAGDGLSSVYFAFDPAWQRFRPGTYGALQELAYARQAGLDWYYLGYFVAGCGRMAYKDRFRPRQHFDWGQRRWVPAPETR